MTCPWSTSIRKLERRGLDTRVRFIRSDVGRMRGERDASVDAVISNELPCDLGDEFQLGKALREFYRALHPGGVMVHGEWSSLPANMSQALAIKADSSTGTDTPSRFWNPDELFVAMGDAGFEGFTAVYFENNLKLNHPAVTGGTRRVGSEKVVSETKR